MFGKWVHVVFGYFLGWSPEEIDRMDYSDVCEYYAILSSMLESMSGAAAFIRKGGKMVI